MTAWPRSLLVVSGVTGVGVGRVLGLVEAWLRLRGLRVFAAKLEDYVRLHGGMATTGYVALTAVSASRVAVRRVFEDALAEITGEASRMGAEVLVLGMHLTYYSGGVVVPNPLLPGLFEGFEKRIIVYLVEDYYDALRRAAAGLRRLASSGVFFRGFRLDPVTYLIWRGVDFNILNMLRGSVEDLRVYVLGVKHPPETLRGLVLDALAAEERLHLYLSHPISLFHGLYRVLGGRVPLREIPGVCEVNAVAEALRGLRLETPLGPRGLVVYEPTTVDELIHASEREIKAACGQASSPTGNRIAPVIDSWNRWPFNGVHSDYGDGGYRVDLLGGELAALLGPAATQLRREICGGEERYMTSLLEELVKAQIEMRDYAYVEQSNTVLALAPAIITEQQSSQGCVIRAGIYISEGVEAEIRRAHALAKRLALLIFPLHADKAAEKLCREDTACRKQVEETLLRAAEPLHSYNTRKPCGDNEAVKAALNDLVARLLGSGKPLSRLGAVDAAAVLPTSPCSPEGRRELPRLLRKLLEGY